MSTINIKEWLNKYPNKCAIIKPNSDGVTAELIEQSAARRADLHANHFDLIYAERGGYEFICGENGIEVYEAYKKRKSER